MMKQLTFNKIWSEEKDDAVARAFFTELYKRCAESGEVTVGDIDECIEIIRPQFDEEHTKEYGEVDSIIDDIITDALYDGNIIDNDAEKCVETIEATIDVADGIWINLTTDKSPYFEWRETADWNWSASFETEEDVDQRLDKEADAFVKDFRKAHPEIEVLDYVIKLIFKEACTRTVEEDEYEIISGVFNGYSSGSPLVIIIPNKNTKSGDYSELKIKPRPGHADYVKNMIV